MMGGFSEEIIAASFERTNRRLWILCTVLVLLLFGTNAGWLYYESQMEQVKTTTQTVTQDLDSESGRDITMNGITNGEERTYSRKPNSDHTDNDR